MVRELSVMALQVLDSPSVGYLPGTMILLAGKTLAVLTDGPRTVEVLLGFTVVLSEQGRGSEEREENK